MANWGNGKQNDWSIAATKLGNILLQVDPDALIIVEGILSAGNLIGDRQFLHKLNVKSFPKAQ